MREREREIERSHKKGSFTCKPSAWERDSGNSHSDTYKACEEASRSECGCACRYEERSLVDLHLFHAAVHEKAALWRFTRVPTH